MRKARMQVWYRPILYTASRSLNYRNLGKKKKEKRERGENKKKKQQQKKLENRERKREIYKIQLIFHFNSANEVLTVPHPSVIYETFSKKSITTLLISFAFFKFNSGRERRNYFARPRSPFHAVTRGLDVEHFDARYPTNEPTPLSLRERTHTHTHARTHTLHTRYFINYKTSRPSRQYKFTGARRIRVRWPRWFIIIITATARPSILAFRSCIFNVDGPVPGSCTGSYITDSFVQAVTKRNKIFPPRNRSVVVEEVQGRVVHTPLFSSSIHPPHPCSLFFLFSSFPFLFFFFALRRTRCIFKFRRAITLSWNQGVVPATRKSWPPPPASFLLQRHTFCNIFTDPTSLSHCFLQFFLNNNFCTRWNWNWDFPSDFFKRFNGDL